jgi:hypothetical protein
LSLLHSFAQRTGGDTSTTFLSRVGCTRAAASRQKGKKKQAIAPAEHGCTVELVPAGRRHARLLSLEIQRYFLRPRSASTTVQPGDPALFPRTLRAETESLNQSLSHAMTSHIHTLFYTSIEFINSTQEEQSTQIKDDSRS